MIDYKMIGARIRAIRNARKMTQEQLAEAVGGRESHISVILRQATVSPVCRL